MSVRLTAEPFDPAERLAAFTAGAGTGVGAVVSFTGLCRAEPGLAALELEAYPGFTEARIAEETAAVSAAHSLLALEVIHRVGRIAPGEPIVWVAAAAPHRRGAFEACDRMMDHLKSRAPFWKREHRLDGAARWIEPTGRDYEDAKRWDAGSASLMPKET